MKGVAKSITEVVNSDFWQHLTVIELLLHHGGVT